MLEIAVCDDEILVATSIEKMLGRLQKRAPQKLR